MSQRCMEALVFGIFCGFILGIATGEPTPLVQYGPAGIEHAR